jgi:hypothetical protein
MLCAMRLCLKPHDESGTQVLSVRMKSAIAMKIKGDFVENVPGIRRTLMMPAEITDAFHEVLKKHMLKGNMDSTEVCA